MTNPDAAKLLPCPSMICNQDEGEMRHADYGYYVECADCGATTASWGTPEDAAKSWNTRPPPLLEKPCVLDRGSELLKYIFELFKSEPDVERGALEVIAALADKGHSAKPQPVRNALNYLHARQFLIRIKYGKYRWNTRPQPAPPEGEPDFEALAKAAARDAVVGLIIDGEPQSAEDTIFASIMKMRLGLAARPKVEDATHISRVTVAGHTFTRLTVLGQRYAEALGKLAERDAELAKANELLNCEDGNVHVEWLREKREWHERHAARQQQKDKA